MQISFDMFCQLDCQIDLWRPLSVRFDISIAGHELKLKMTNN